MGNDLGLTEHDRKPRQRTVTVRSPWAWRLASSGNGGRRLMLVRFAGSRTRGLPLSVAQLVGNREGVDRRGHRVGVGARRPVGSKLAYVP